MKFLILPLDDKIFHLSKKLTEIDAIKEQEMSSSALFTSKKIPQGYLFK